MKAPAMAKELTSMPKMPRSGAPKIRNARKIASETSVALQAWMVPVFALISKIMGIDPGMSIMANRTIKLATISRKWICIWKISAKIVFSGSRE
jgi:hypothetical protein